MPSGGNRNDQPRSDRYKLHPVSGEAKLDLFPQGGMLDGSDDTPTTANECRAICLERGVDSSLVAASQCPIGISLATRHLVIGSTIAVGKSRSVS